jgi:LruC domain-containing protein
MKKSSVNLISFLLVVLVALSSCKKETSTVEDPLPEGSGFESLVVPEDFTWETSTYVVIDLLFVDDKSDPVETAFEIHSEYPNGVKFMEASSNSNGEFKNNYKVSKHHQSFVVIVPDQEPVEMVFGTTTLNNTEVFEASATIVVENPIFKSTKAESYQYFPAADRYGTIAFEDLWPSKGDYDLNDVVVDYNVMATLNEDFKVTNINMHLFLRAQGAALDNGFAISFRQKWSDTDVPVADIGSVSITPEYSIPEGWEDTEYPSIVIIPSVKAPLHNQWNTIESDDFRDPMDHRDEMEFFVEISFNTPAENGVELDLPLQNPFEIINQDRELEVHLPYYLPTSLASSEYANTVADASDEQAFFPFTNPNPGNWFTYMTQEKYPWAIDVYFDAGPSDELYRYPEEKIEISEAYANSFSSWVETNLPEDWFAPDYRTGSCYDIMPTPSYPVP